MGDVVRPECARPVCHRPLPEPPADLKPGTLTLVLFYREPPGARPSTAGPRARNRSRVASPHARACVAEYVEPKWSEQQHREALRQVNAIGREHGVCGRGRCAAEGLNCTLTGSAAGVRGFCNGLRAWKPELFNETDFKLTDGVAPKHGFKALTIRKTDELVAYGLAGDDAPELRRSSARHVEADEYHEMMTKPDTVIIDVRNAYESAIGHFAPPEGGATLIDPKMRNSHEFPKWLNAPETQQQLQGKKVMMYCTGGIRCERASALLDAMTRTSDGGFGVEDVVMVRGGIERYMKTYPSGGYWKGKNYLFDRRLEQLPESKSAAALAADVESWCCVCRAPCAAYRGQFECAGVLPMPIGKCGVPVIVCKGCALTNPDAAALRCPLCEEGYAPPTKKPDMASTKRKLAELAAASGDAPPAPSLPSAPTSKKARRDAKASAEPSCRLFVGNLPFVVCFGALRDALAGDDGDAAVGPFLPGGAGGPSVLRVQWLSDHSSKLFYGSAFVQMATLDAAKELVARAAAPPEPAAKPGAPLTRKQRKRAKAGKGPNTKGGIVMGGRRLRIHFAPPKQGDVWPPVGEQRERPPVC